MPAEPSTASWGSGPSLWSILVHGGAGDIAEARIASRVAGCERAAAVGAAVLAAGGSALDAVERAVAALEEDPLFNAGTGSSLDEEGGLALDASIMDGRTLGAGAVCALPAFKSPIAIARTVMEKTRHVLLAGEGAARFAVAHGFERVDPATMITDDARAKLTAARAAPSGATASGGTVGAVARDVHGHVAAATSTGGMVNKLVGRVGDSPLVGAGTYADDTRGACSTTGHGEGMIRVCLAKTAVDRTLDATPMEAARSSLAMMLTRTEATGGAIIAHRDGSLGMARTTRAMTWAAEMNGGQRASGA